MNSNGSPNGNVENGHHQDPPIAQPEEEDDESVDEDGLPLENGGLSEGSKTEQHDNDAIEEETDDEDEEESTDEDGEEEEPALKYERMQGGVEVILEKDTASAIAVSGKLLVSRP